MNESLDRVSMESKILTHKDFSQDDRFMHVKLSLCTQMQKANGMHFSKELLQSKLQEIDFMPIVGAIKIVEKDDGTVKYTLGSHEVELDIVDNELVYKKNTIVLGVALPNTAKFENITRHDETLEYITFEALLFQEKYPQLKNIIDLNTDASMELDKVEASYDESNGWYEVSDFRFIAHCLIGVPPAFKLAGVVNQFSLEDFKLEFSDVLDEIKTSLNKFNRDGKEDISMNNEQLENYEGIEKNVDDKDDENQEDIVNNENLEDEKTSCNKSFELSHDDIRTAIWNQLNPIGQDGFREWNYWIMEVFDTYFVCQSEDETNKYYKFTFEKNHETEEVLVDMESKTEVFVTYLTQEEKDALNQKDEKFNELTENYSVLKEEVEVLRQFKDDVEETQAKEKAEMELQAKNEELEKFSAKLSKKEILEEIDDVNNFSLEEIRTKLSVVLANKLLSENTTFKEDKIINIDNADKTYSRSERLLAELKNKKTN